MSNLSILEQTRAWLEEATAPFSRISVNADIPIRWLYRLHAGEIDDPGIRNVEKLYNYLRLKSNRHA